MELKSDERLKHWKPMYNRVLAVILTRPWCPIVIPSWFLQSVDQQHLYTSLHTFSSFETFDSLSFEMPWRNHSKRNITQSYPICHIHETDAGCVARMFLHLHNLGRSFHLASSPARRGRTSLRWEQRSLSRIVWQMEGLKRHTVLSFVRPLWGHCEGIVNRRTSWKNSCRFFFGTGVRRIRKSQFCSWIQGSKSWTKWWTYVCIYSYIYSIYVIYNI